MRSEHSPQEHRPVAPPSCGAAKRPVMRGEVAAPTKDHQSTQPGHAPCDPTVDVMNSQGGRSPATPTAGSVALTQRPKHSVLAATDACHMPPLPPCNRRRRAPTRHTQGRPQAPASTQGTTSPASTPTVQSRQCPLAAGPAAGPPQPTRTVGPLCLADTAHPAQWPTPTIGGAPPTHARQQEPSRPVPMNRAPATQPAQRYGRDRGNNFKEPRPRP